MKEQEDKKPHLTAKEEEVMRILWEHGPMLVKEVLEYLPEPKPHVNTVSTVIRGREKNVVSISVMRRIFTSSAAPETAVHTESLPPIQSNMPMAGQ